MTVADVPDIPQHCPGSGQTWLATPDSELQCRACFRTPAELNATSSVEAGVMVTPSHIVIRPPRLKPSGELTWQECLGKAEAALTEADLIMSRTIQRPDEAKICLLRASNWIELAKQKRLAS